MPSSAPGASIWKQMNYTPPRGSCNHKESLLSPKCPCLRFMLHPLKVTTSFDCDGCGHHASFHNMSSPADDAIIARWAAEERENAPAADAPRSRKRPRRALLEAGPSANADAGAGAGAEGGILGVTSFTEDVELGGGESQQQQRQGKTWGDRFSSWSFSREEEPVKTPPKKQAERRSGRGAAARKRHSAPGSDFEVRSDIVDLD